LRYNRDGNLVLDPPPDNSWTIAGQLEYWLWRIKVSPIGNTEASRELDRLLQLLFAKPLANGFADPEASAEWRGQHEQRIRAAEELRLRTK
jgi:hypothetical protein